MRCLIDVDPGHWPRRLTTRVAYPHGAFVESPLVHGVDMTPDGTALLVVNTEDDRLIPAANERGWQPRGGWTAWLRPW